MKLKADTRARPPTGVLRHHVLSTLGACHSPRLSGRGRSHVLLSLPANRDDVSPGNDSIGNEVITGDDDTIGGNVLRVGKHFAPIPDERGLVVEHRAPSDRSIADYDLDHAAAFRKAALHLKPRPSRTRSSFTGLRYERGLTPTTLYSTPASFTT